MNRQRLHPVPLFGLRRQVQAAGATALFVLLTGCGSDGGESLTEEAFRDRANAICAEGGEEIGEAVGAVFGGAEPTPETLQGALDTIVSSTRRQLDEIDALAAPGSIAGDVDAMLVELRGATDAAAAQGVGFWEDDGDPWATGNDMAARLGLDVCATS